MTVDQIMTLISNNFFPIAACIAMGYFFSKLNDNYRSDIKELTSSHKEEMNSLREALDNNTNAINLLINKIT